MSTIFFRYERLQLELARISFTHYQNREIIMLCRIYLVIFEVSILDASRCKGPSRLSPFFALLTIFTKRDRCAPLSRDAHWSEILALLDIFSFLIWLISFRLFNESIFSGADVQNAQ